MTNLPDKLIYPIPYAGAIDAERKLPLREGTTDQNPTWAHGFLKAYSTPKSNGGKYVTRGEINALGYIGTKNDYYRMCGGINTFDAEFAAMIGGYPKDAILDYFDGENFRKVVSLVENNKEDFTKGSLNNWKIIGLETVNSEKVIINNFNEYTFPTSVYDNNLIITFRAPKTGSIGIEVTRQERDTSTITSYPSDNHYLGAGFLFNVSTDGNVPNTNIHHGFTGWDILQVIGSAMPISAIVNNNTQRPGYKAAMVKYGDIVSICFVNGVGVQSIAAATSSCRTIKMDFNIFML